MKLIRYNKVPTGHRKTKLLFASSAYGTAEYDRDESDDDTISRRHSRGIVNTKTMKALSTYSRPSLPPTASFRTLSEYRDRINVGIKHSTKETP